MDEKEKYFENVLDKLGKSLSDTVSEFEKQQIDVSVISCLFSEPDGHFTMFFANGDQRAIITALLNSMMQNKKSVRMIMELLLSIKEHRETIRITVLKHYGADMSDKALAEFNKLLK